MESTYHVKFKPEYIELITKYEKLIEDLSQMIIDKYCGEEYVAMRIYRPSIFYRTIQEEILIATKGLREQYSNLLMVATEHSVTFKV